MHWSFFILSFLVGMLVGAMVKDIMKKYHYEKYFDENGQLNRSGLITYFSITISLALFVINFLIFITIYIHL